MTQQQKGFSVYMPLLFSLVLVVGMKLGFDLYKNLKGSPDAVTIKSQISELDEVFSYIDARYVDTINSEQMIEKVINATLKDLDPHSNYIPAKDLQDVNEQLQGNFEGIGIEFTIIKDTIVVVTPIAGGPSEKLGILAGDKIVKITDTLVAGIGITNKDVTEKLRGKGGTYANISIYRKGIDELLDFDIKRAKIPLVSVDANYMLDEEVGYIKINRFSAKTYNEFMTALMELEGQGMRRLILDLRQNPGGYLMAAVNIADELLGGSSMIVYTQGRNFKKKEHLARRAGMFERGKLCVLIDEGSASASEIVAGAIQDWDRGSILGRRSFGKGLVQEQYALSNGGALRLTIARYYTPAGRCIQKPYDEGRESYAKDIEKRQKNGELSNPDSTMVEKEVKDSLVYETMIKKRKVYGGGGITPDIFLPIDTIGIETFTIKARSTIPEFVYDYFGNNRSQFDKYADHQQFQKEYQIDTEMYNEFKAHVKEEVGFLDEALLDKHQDELQVYIRAYLARQLWNNKGFYPIYHEKDVNLKAALKHIKEE